MLRRNVTARAAIDIRNTTEETVNVNETNYVPLEIRFQLPHELKKLIRLPN